MNSRRRFVRGPESESAAGVRLADLSVRPRAGFRGPGSVAWLQSQGIEVRAEPNRAFVRPDGSLVAMLSRSETLILGAAAASPEAGTRCYALPRRDSHYWFMVAGAAAPELFSHLCSVDLRPAAFPIGAVAQTMLARTSAVIIRGDADDLSYHVLGDSAFAAYVWATLTAQLKELEDHVRR